MTEHIEKAKEHICFQFKYMVVFFCLFAGLSFGLNQVADIYYKYFDKTRYYEIKSPITVGKMDNIACTHIDAYINRQVLVPIKGTSVKQLTLVRAEDGKSERIRSFTTDIQAGVTNGYETMIAHWDLPCDIPLGAYYFEGVVGYRVRDIYKTEHFVTEKFNVIATPSAILSI